MTPILDDRGRLFGRWNLIDAGLCVGLIVVIAVGYSVYLLFRTPVPAITDVTPPTVQVSAARQWRLTGRDLRPYLRAALAVDGRTVPVRLSVESTTHAWLMVDVAPAPGSYDVVLYDDARELTRAPAALRVVANDPPPQPARLARRFAVVREDVLLIGEREVRLVVVRDAHAGTCIGWAVSDDTSQFLGAIPCDP